jgi:hypothetical protein
LCETAKKNKWEATTNTGIHVHLDIRSMERDHFRNKCVLYSIFEPALYRWIGYNRDKNIHCLPWFAADADIENIGGIFTSDNRTAQAIIKKINRYAGLNLNSIMTFGTMEYRQLQTTFDPNRIFNWINMILCMRKAAQTWKGTSEELLTHCRKLGMKRTMEFVFGPYTSELWYDDFAKDGISIGTPTADLFLRSSRGRASKSDSSIMLTFESVRGKGAIPESDEQGEAPGFAKYKAKRALSKTSTVKVTLSNGLTLELPE